MRIPVVTNTQTNINPEAGCLYLGRGKTMECRIFLGGYYGTTFGVHFLVAIVTTGRFVAFAPHVTRGLQTAIVSGVRHNASELASALTGETILQRNPPSRIINTLHIFLLNHIFIIKGLVLRNKFPKPCLFVLRDV